MKFADDTAGTQVQNNNGTHPSKEDDSQVQDESGVVMSKLSRKKNREVCGRQQWSGSSQEEMRLHTGMRWINWLYGAVTTTWSSTPQNDLIVWTYLSPVQEDIYKQFISLDHIKELLLTTRPPLALALLRLELNEAQRKV